ncbi:MAG: TIR domain-containing protein [Novosphingobium sp.]
MPDIFLSYNREDQAVARRFAEGFEHAGLSVWWDVTLRSGEAYDEVTEAALRGAGAVVVLWSPRSVVSRWVRAEATLADRAGTLVPAMIEPCERPIMFELTQTAELGHWQGGDEDSAWRAFLGDVKRHIAARPPEARTASAQTPGETVRSVAQAHAGKPPPGKRPTLAVLPFTNRSGSSDDEALGDAIAEDVSIALARGKGLRLIAHNAVAGIAERESDIRRIGAALGADYVMEGNVRRIGGTLRATAQLLEAKSGAILWSEKFDHADGDRLAVIEDLAEDVSRHLAPQIQKIEMDRASKKAAVETPWDAMQRCWALIPRMLPDKLREAVIHARRAVELAPNMAVAASTLGMMLGLLYQRTGSLDPALLSEALEHMDRALQLDESHTTVLVQAATVRYYAQDWNGALHLAERAVELNPQQPDALHALAGAYTRIERDDEALALLDRADHIAPHGFSLTISLTNRCWALYGLGRIDEAVETAGRILKIRPGDHTGLMLRTVYLAEAGDEAAALRDMAELRRIYPDEPLELFLNTIRTSRQTDVRRTRNAEVFERVWRRSEADAAGNPALNHAAD